MTINKVGSKGIEDGAVAAIDLADETVSSDKFANSTIENAKLSNSSVTLAGTSISLGASGSVNNQFVDWQSLVTSDGSTVTTMESGKGYFIDNSSAEGIVKLPASANRGDFVAIKDYAGNFGTNKLTIQRNSHKIQGNSDDNRISTDRASVILVYADSTKGWLYVNHHNVQSFIKFVTATGGTITTSGDFKIHTFTGDGCFVVSCAGNNAGSNTVDYLVVAGGGGGGHDNGGGAGGGGFRLSNSTCMPSPQTSPLATPTALSVTATTFPVTVGGGGAGGTGSPGGTNGSNSVFSTITSAGGGKGGEQGGDGGSGGGNCSSTPTTNGAGNTPPVSPPQGNPGGLRQSTGTTFSGGGGGGAAAAGQNSSNPSGGDGGSGSYVVSSGFAGCNGEAGPVSGARYFSGGGGGGGQPYTSPYAVQGAPGVGGGGVSRIACTPTDETKPGTANTGGGGAGGAGSPSTGGAGGKGIVIIRYKFQ